MVLSRWGVDDPAGRRGLGGLVVVNSIAFRDFYFLLVSRRVSNSLSSFVLAWILLLLV